MRGRRRREVVVRGFGAGAPTGIVIFGPLVLACALGRSGRRVLKREGDGATPVGRWAVREVFYRPDRIRRPQTRLKVSPIRPRDGWCDAPGDRNYNRAVTLPYAASAETLWRIPIVVVPLCNETPACQFTATVAFRADAEPCGRALEHREQFCDRRRRARNQQPDAKPVAKSPHGRCSYGSAPARSKPDDPKPLGSHHGSEACGTRGQRPPVAAHPVELRTCASARGGSRGR